jgi:hypothetical protein
MALKILFVQPTNDVQSGDFLVPPLWPSVLSSLTPDKHEVEFLHCGFEKPTEKKLSGYDLVGINVLTTMANDAYKVGDLCKNLGIKCVMGGIHTYIFPKEAKQHCDSVILGEALKIFPYLIFQSTKNTGSLLQILPR